MDNETRMPNPSTTDQDDSSNLEKLTQSYLLLKQKVCRTHDLIKQYNDKLKECERLKTDLDTMNKQAKKVTCNYNSTLAKVIKLELQSTDYKKNIESLTAKVAEHEIKVAADKQHIQQLICKIKDVEEQHAAKIMEYDLEKSSLQVKVKELEQELKAAKKSHDTKMKKAEKKITTSTNSCQTESLPPPPIEKKSTSEIGVNTVPMECKSNEVSPKKPKVVEKCTMTNEFYSTKDDLYPLFCAKCEVHLDPPPLEKICKIMTESCPKMVEKISSPPSQKMPLKVSNGVRDERCKVENVANSSSTSPTVDLEGQQMHDFTNVLPVSPIPMNQMNFPTDLRSPSQISNLVNRNNYYMNSTGVASMPLPAPNTTNQNSHCVDMTAMISSLSLMNSLEKRIDTLETKVKKQLKQKSIENNSYCQHKPPTSCCSFDANSSLQSNLTIELWKRMMDLSDRKPNFDRCEGHADARANKRKIKTVKLKRKKRLQRGIRNTWRVESVPMRLEQSPVRRKMKRQKKRHFVLKPPEIVLDQDEDMQKYDSDSDIPSLPESETPLEEANAAERHSSNSNITSKSVGTETDSGVLSDSVESNRAGQIETESVHLDPVDLENSREEKSMEIQEDEEKEDEEKEEEVEADAEEEDEEKEDEVKEDEEKEDEEKEDEEKEDEEKEDEEKEDESSKRMTCSVDSLKQTHEKKEDESSKRMTFSVNSLKQTDEKKEDESSKRMTCSVDSLKQMDEKKEDDSSKRMTCSVDSLKQTASDTMIHTDVKKHNKSSEEISHPTTVSNIEMCVESVNAECISEPVLESVEFNSSSNVKLNKCRDRKKCDSRVVLLKKLRSLKRTSKTANVCNVVVDATQISKCETARVECPQSLTREKEEDTAMEDYIPKKRSRIAHIPKGLMDIQALQKRTPIRNTNLQRKKESCSDVNPKESNEKVVKVRKNVSIEELFNENADVEIHEIRSPDTSFHEHTSVDTSRLSKLEDIKEESHVPNACSASRKKSTEETVNSTAQFNDNLSIEQSSSKPTESKNRDKPDYSLNACTKRILEPSHAEQTDINAIIEEESVTHKNPVEKNKVKNVENTTIVKPRLHERQSSITVSSTLEQLDRKEITDLTNKSEESGNVIQISTETIKSFTFLSRMRQYAEETKRGSKKNQDKQLVRLRNKMDKFVKKQLQSLVDGNWETTLHNEILQKLKSMCCPRIIAKCIVEFISTDEKAAEPLDHSHTPPAPLMTNSQQRIVTLIVDLQNSVPNFIQLVQAAIEYELFRLNNAVKRSVLDTLTRIYTVLARTQKDREKVRIFCCDALYCLGLHAITILYIVLISWPEVFPKSDTTKDLLPRCIAHLISTQQAASQDFPKLKALKQLVQLFYEYRPDTMSKELLLDCLTALQEKPCNRINTAIILLAKREGTSWTYANIVGGELLPMIVQRRHPDMYRAFHLLGNLMRAFPTDDKDNCVAKIVEQLCALAESGEGPEDQQEGVISALLSLSRHKFQEVSQAVMKWTPAKPLHPRTITQFEGFLNQRQPEFWKGFLRKNKYLTDYKSAKSKT